ERAAAACAGFTARPTGTVRLAVFQSAGRMLLPPLLTAVAGEDGLAIECVERDVGQPDFVPLTGEFDIVIAHRPDRGYVWGGSGTRVVNLLREPLDIALPPDHPLAGRTALRPVDLVGEAWVTVEE